jgi:chromosome segregation ATPase
MSHLDILKDQMQAMGHKITQIKREMEQLQGLIGKLTKDKSDIETQLSNAEIQHTKLFENYNYLSEVQKETMNNYNQIEDAATTLLDILKSKCDSIS